MATALRIPTETQDLEEDWDPQGLNSLDKDVLESFGDSEEEAEVDVRAGVLLGQIEDEDGVHSDDLDRDGLTELEEMERLLKSEESPLDFAMVAEEE
jgi:hypothetical protein